MCTTDMFTVKVNNVHFMMEVYCLYMTHMSAAGGGFVGNVVVGVMTDCVYVCVCGLGGGCQCVSDLLS